MPMPRLTLVFVLLFPSLVLAQPLPRVVVLATGGTTATAVFRSIACRPCERVDRGLGGRYRRWMACLSNPSGDCFVNTWTNSFPATKSSRLRPRIVNVPDPLI